MVESRLSAIVEAQAARIERSKHNSAVSMKTLASLYRRPEVPEAAIFEDQGWPISLA